MSKTQQTFWWSCILSFLIGWSAWVVIEDYVEHKRTEYEINKYSEELMNQFFELSEGIEYKPNVP